MTITVYAYDEELQEDGQFNLNVKDSITDKEVREHVDGFINDWTGIHFHSEDKRVVLPS